jgi:hypothetical protein
LTGEILAPQTLRHELRNGVERDEDKKRADHDHAQRRRQSR